MNTDDEYYRQVANYEQTVLPVRRDIDNMKRSLFLEMVCEEYRLIEAKRIYRSWRETKGQRIGRQIERYDVPNILRSLTWADCAKGYGYKAMIMAGESTVKSLWNRQRKMKAPQLFGVEQAHRIIQKQKNQLYNGWISKYESGKIRAVTLRLYIAEQLKRSSEQVINTSLYDAVRYTDGWQLIKAATLLASINYFEKCWRDFHEAEQILLTPLTTPVKGTPAADVRRYFPQAATIHGTIASNENALFQLAVWMLHWAELPSDEHYSLPSQLRKLMAAQSDAGKFLKACKRLHEALILLAATEQGTKALLGKEYTPQSQRNIQSVLGWWAGWIREQQTITPIVRTPADVYLEALRRIPLVVEWVNSSPRWIVYPAPLDSTSFDADIRALREGFEAAMPTLSTIHARHLRSELGKLSEIDLEGFKRRREWFEKQEYGLDFLPEDYPMLRFELPADTDRLRQGQWVGPSFWTTLIELLRHKQNAAQLAFEKLNAALGEVLPVPKSNAFIIPQFDADAASELNNSIPWARIEELAEKIGLRRQGRFTPAGNKIAVAGAGFIDGLRDAEILTATSNLADLYIQFSQHYSQTIKADRATNTRTIWHEKTRKELGLPSFKVPKKKAQPPN